jgi:peroxidase
VPDQTFGFDLFAIDIQRGRDHGLPPYYQWREMCNLPNATTFEQMKEVFEDKEETQNQ